MKYFEAFLDNWFLPICLVVVAGWIGIRQKFIFDEHKDMLTRINHLETECEVIDSKMNSMTDTQKEIRDDVKLIFQLVTDIRLEQAENRKGPVKSYLQDSK